MTDRMGADVLLVTVTQVETTAVLKAFGFAGKRANAKDIDDRFYFDLGTVNGARVSMTQSEMGVAGVGASLQTVTKGIIALSPAAVIMVGIAFGIDEEKQCIGDILVSKQLRLYDLQRGGTSKDRKTQITLAGDQPHCPPWLLGLARSSEATWNGAKLRFGALLTGERLVDNLDFREQLRAFEPEAIGGEMEGAGLYVACHDQKIEWLLVKAICDFADGQKAKDKAERQALAADNAAAFVHHVLRSVKVDWAKRHRPRAMGMEVASRETDAEGTKSRLRHRATSSRPEVQGLPDFPIVSGKVDPAEVNWSSRAASGRFADIYPGISYAFRKSIAVEVDPTLDVTVVNNRREPMVLTHVGVRILSIALQVRVMGVPCPARIPQTESYVVDIPDVTAENVPPQTRHLWSYGPLEVGRDIWTTLACPIRIPKQEPFRFGLLLRFLFGLGCGLGCGTGLRFHLRSWCRLGFWFGFNLRRGHRLGFRFGIGLGRFHVIFHSRSAATSEQP